MELPGQSAWTTTKKKHLVVSKRDTREVYISHILWKILLGLNDKPWSPLGTCPIMFQDLRRTLESPSNVRAPAAIVSMDGTETLRV